METPEKITVTFEVPLHRATKADFPAHNGTPVYGIPYFCLRSNGQDFDKKVYILTDQTDMTAFKELYAKGQIYVPTLL
jgi:hypothetical protein